MAKDVKCCVTSCKYYCSGDSCTAGKIEISPECASCNCSTETNCVTFCAK